MSDPLTLEIQALQTSLASQGVKYALSSFVDIHGMCKAKSVPLIHLGQMMAESELFTGAALDGVPQAVSDDEVAAHPDPNSMTILPWKPDLALFTSDLYLRDKPFAACSRGILKQVLAEAATMGFTCNLGIETEFFLLRETADGRVIPVSDRDTLAKPCYDLQGLFDNYEWVTEIVEAMNQMGRILCSITSDTSGCHDLICGCSKAASNTAKYGDGDSNNSRNNFLKALGKRGLTRKDLMPNINLFSRVAVLPNGDLQYDRTCEQAGSYIDLRAEMNVLAIVSNCPHVLHPSTEYNPQPIQITIWKSPAPRPDDPCRTANPEVVRGFVNTDALSAQD
jgi:Domain of unknown function (DUF1989)/Glutamine synthetase, catalytic domain